MPLAMGVIAIYLNQIKSRQDALDTELRQLSRGRTLTIVLNMISNSLEKDRFSADELADAMKAKGLWSHGTAAGPIPVIAAACSAGLYGAGLDSIHTTIGFASFLPLQSHSNTSRIKFSNDKLKQKVLGNEFFIRNMLNSIRQRSAAVQKTLLGEQIIYEMRIKYGIRLFFSVENEVVTVLKLVQKFNR